MKNTNKALRFISSVLAAAAVGCVMPMSALSASASAAETEVTLGDVDMNNAIDSCDALIVMRCSVGLIELSDEQNEAADVNTDGVADSIDALTILQAAIGIGTIGGSANTQLLLRSDITRPVSYADNSYIEEVVSLCNEERAKNGIAPLVIDDTLCKASAIRVSELDKSLDHIRPDGTKWASVLSQFDYHYLTVGENVAGGYKEAKDVVKAWMDSEGHRKNILNPDFTRIGIGYTFIEDRQYGYYWEQLFVGVADNLDDETASKKALLDLINKARRDKGMSELAIDTTLDVIAEIRATDITVDFSNKRPDGSSWMTLVDEYDVDYTKISQAYCAGIHSEKDVFDYYMNGSDTPKFLDPEKGFTRIGIGHAFADGSQYGNYWVLIFAD